MNEGLVGCECSTKLGHWSDERKDVLCFLEQGLLLIW